MPENASHNALIEQFKRLVGASYTLSEPARMQPYCKGFRFGEGI